MIIVAIIQINLDLQVDLALSRRKVKALQRKRDLHWWEMFRGRDFG